MILCDGYLHHMMFVKIIFASFPRCARLFPALEVVLNQAENSTEYIRLLFCIENCFFLGTKLSKSYRVKARNSEVLKKEVVDGI